MSKKIILGMMANPGIFKLIEKNLAYYGFDVISIINEQKFKYPSLYSNIRSHIARFFGNKEVKKEIEQEFIFNVVNNKLSHIDQVDYSLFILAHIYNNKTIELVKSKTSKKMVNYQYDGISRFPEIIEKVPYFDRFFVFDPKDLGLPYDFLPCTNFYFDYNLNEVEPIKYDFYFIGIDVVSRREAIIAFSQYASEKGLNLKFDIKCDKKKIKKLRKSVYKNENIHLITQYVDYETNLKQAKQSKVLVDFIIGEHKGLSFRTFEALGYRKKLITTNEYIKHYDFYHPNNIFIWNGKNLAELDEFMSKPYIEIDQKIRKKYSFRNWLYYILDIPPYDIINLPKES